MAKGRSNARKKRGSYKMVQAPKCRANGSRSKKRRRKWEDEKKLYCENPFSSRSVFRAQPCPMRSFLTSRGATFSLFSSLLYPSSPSTVLAAPFRTRCHHKSGVTAIFSTSDPLCGCSLWIVWLEDVLTGLWTRHSAFSLLCFSPLG